MFKAAFSLKIPSISEQCFDHIFKCEQSNSVQLFKLNLAILTFLKKSYSINISLFYTLSSIEKSNFNDIKNPNDH